MTTPAPAPQPADADDTPAPAGNPASSADTTLGNAELQEQYRQVYLLQLRRQSCPDCGEEFSSS